MKKLFLTLITCTYEILQREETFVGRTHNCHAIPPSCTLLTWIPIFVPVLFLYTRLAQLSTFSSQFPLPSYYSSASQRPCISRWWNTVTFFHLIGMWMPHLCHFSALQRRMRSHVYSTLGVCCTSAVVGALFVTQFLLDCTRESGKHCSICSVLCSLARVVYTAIAVPLSECAHPQACPAQRLVGTDPFVVSHVQVLVPQILMLKLPAPAFHHLNQMRKQVFFCSPFWLDSVEWMLCQVTFVPEQCHLYTFWFSSWFTQEVTLLFGGGWDLFDSL